MASVERHVEAERPGHRRGHLGHLEGVGEARALVVVGEHEHLGLAGKPAEGGGVEDAVAVALEAGPPLVGLLGPAPIAGPDRPGGGRHEQLVLELLTGQPADRRPGRGLGVGMGDAHAGLLAGAGHRRRPAVGPLLHRIVDVHGPEDREGVSQRARQAQLAPSSKWSGTSASTSSQTAWSEVTDAVRSARAAASVPGSRSASTSS